MLPREAVVVWSSAAVGSACCFKGFFLCVFSSETGSAITASCIGLGSSLTPPAGQAGKPVPGYDGESVLSFLFKSQNKQLEVPCRAFNISAPLLCCWAAPLNTNCSPLPFHQSQWSMMTCRRWNQEPWEILWWGKKSGYVNVFAQAAWLQLCLFFHTHWHETICTLIRFKLSQPLILIIHLWGASFPLYTSALILARLE